MLRGLVFFEMWVFSNKGKRLPVGSFINYKLLIMIMVKNKKIGDGFRLGRRGDFKYDIIIILLLGLVVVGLVLFFIFGEYFQEKDISWETCRQSVILRNSMPEETFAKMVMVSFKDKFPLKCKTDVVTIDYKDVLRAEKEISETMVSCWFLFGNGGYRIFPGAAFDSATTCMYCARVHLAPSVREFYRENEININDGLEKLEFKNGLSYYEYLSNVGEQNPFQLVGSWHNDYLTIGGAKRPIGGDVNAPVSAVPIGVPEKFDVERGDLFILYHNFLAYGNSEVVASLLFFQERGAKFGDKEFSSALDALAWDKGSAIKENVDWWIDGRANAICEQFDGVPA